MALVASVLSITRLGSICAKFCNEGDDNKLINEPTKSDEWVVLLVGTRKCTSREERHNSISLLFTFALFVISSAALTGCSFLDYVGHWSVYGSRQGQVYFPTSA